MKISTLNSYEVIEYLDVLSDSESLEIYPVQEETLSIYIPYMMNDAVEQYMKLSDCSINGTLSSKKSSFLLCAYPESENGSYILTISQDEADPVEILYTQAELFTECYQYHRICHFWRKEDVFIRRLVYIAGTLFDKVQYLPEDRYTEAEAEISELMEFAPFRYFSPIREDLDAYYSDSEKGIDRMNEIIDSVGSRKLKQLLMEYRTDYNMNRLSGKSIIEFAEMLKEEQEVLHEIDRRIEKASSIWEMRPLKNEEAMQKEKDRINHEMRLSGFSGTYPEFFKGSIHRIYYEEHPFVMDLCEYEDYSCRISGYIEYSV